MSSHFALENVDGYRCLIAELYILVLSHVRFVLFAAIFTAFSRNETNFLSLTHDKVDIIYSTLKFVDGYIDSLL